MTNMFWVSGCLGIQQVVWWSLLADPEQMFLKIPDRQNMWIVITLGVFKGLQWYSNILCWWGQHNVIVCISVKSCFFYCYYILQSCRVGKQDESVLWLICVCLQGGSVGTYIGWLKLTCNFHLWVPCKMIVLLTGLVFIWAVGSLVVHMM